jgi:hypothetical protein
MGTRGHRVLKPSSTPLGRVKSHVPLEAVGSYLQKYAFCNRRAHCAVALYELVHIVWSTRTRGLFLFVRTCFCVSFISLLTESQNRVTT